MRETSRNSWVLSAPEWQLTFTLICTRLVYAVKIPQICGWEAMPITKTPHFGASHIFGTPSFLRRLSTRRSQGITVSCPLSVLPAQLRYLNHSVIVITFFRRILAFTSTEVSFSTPCTSSCGVRAVFVETYTIFVRPDLRRHHSGDIWCLSVLDNIASMP